MGVHSCSQYTREGTRAAKLHKRRTRKAKHTVSLVHVLTNYKTPTILTIFGPPRSASFQGRRTSTYCRYTLSRCLLTVGFDIRADQRARIQNKRQTAQGLAREALNPRRKDLQGCAAFSPRSFRYCQPCRTVPTVQDYRIGSSSRSQVFCKTTQQDYQPQRHSRDNPHRQRT